MLTWTAETPARWDEDKERVLGGAPAGSLPLERYRGAATLPGEWWRAERDGRAVGYGWMDTTWGDAEILLAVAPDEERRGVGGFVLDRLEEEARRRGLNYLHNVVLPTHPERERVARWLKARGFDEEKDGERLLRAVRGDGGETPGAPRRA